MIVASHQPLFMPWLGFFHKMAQADTFILSDDVQFNKANFQHRNRIVCAQTGRPRWLTVPVRFRSSDPIRDVQIGETPGEDWRQMHLRLLWESYHDAPYYRWLAPELTRFYGQDYGRLVDASVGTIILLARLLAIDTRLVRAGDLGQRPPGRVERLVWLCRSVGADGYLAGLGGSNHYINENGGGVLFRDAGVTIIRQDFRHPTYPQTGPAFLANLSVLDLLFNTGPRARDYLRSSL